MTFPRNRPRQTERNEVRNDGAYEETRVVGGCSPTWPPSLSPSQGMFLRSEYLGSARTLSFPRTGIVLHRHVRHDPHTPPTLYVLDTQPCAARRPNNYGHRYRSSRTYEEETRDASTTTIDSIARATNEDILRFGIFLPSSSVEKREAESGRRKFGSVRGKRRRANVVVATRGRFGYAWD